MLDEKEIIVVTQKDETVEEPEMEDLYEVGTITEIKQLVKLPNGMIKVIVEGIKRGKVLEFLKEEDFFAVKVEVCADEIAEIDTEMKALMRSVLDQFQDYIKYNRHLPAETMMSVVNIEEPGRLADIIASHLELQYKDEQKLLESIIVKERYNNLFDIIQDEIEILKVEQEIQKRVKKQVEKTQKEFYLREQMKAIKDELDLEEDEDDEIAEYREKLAKLNLPEKIAKKIEEEIKKLAKIPGISPETAVIKNYLDCVFDLPWEVVKEENLDLKKSEVVLNEDHYGLEDIKERILEFLAVRKLAPGKKSPILCLIGAPGVGKTSLGKSIARATKRDFVHISLGGVRDEAEIRGHRRTYIGSRPGRIINAMREAGSKNPVFLLDEVDKMTADFRGDPAAALLEVLDEHNSEFTDHYLELPFDLSQVFFITTANVSYPIPAPLLDRMEVIEMPGYTEDEKVQIAERHLLPRIFEEHGLDHDKINISTNTIYQIIREYTREAGVRNLERKLATIARKVSKEIVEGRNKKASITTQSIEKYLGVPRFKYEKSAQENRIGVATGMAYTETGGDILDIEVAVVPGKGKLILTGSLGDIMKESAQAALSYIRSIHEKLKLPEDFYKKHDLHIHVPEGAVPKDGPSAGITIASAIP